MFSSQVLTALLLASFAGLATTFGALIAFFRALKTSNFSPFRSVFRQE